MKTKTICVLNGKVVMMNNKKRGQPPLFQKKCTTWKLRFQVGERKADKKGQNLVTSLGSFASK